MVLVPVVLLGACAAAEQLVVPKPAEPPIYQREQFRANAPYWRAFDASGTQVCEGARQALMSQGYVVVGHSALSMSARKFFRPEPGAGVELALQVTCVDTPPADGKATTPGGIAYVTAWQDHLVTRKNANAASLGVNAVGSISLPLTSADDVLVKVGVDMVVDPAFYDRFHNLVAAMLAPGGPAAVRR